MRKSLVALATSVFLLASPAFPITTFLHAEQTKQTGQARKTGKSEEERQDDAASQISLEQISDFEQEEARREAIEWNYQIIESHIKKVVAPFFVKGALAASETYRKDRARLGVEKLIEIYSDLHLLPLKLAKEYAGREIPEEKYVDLKIIQIYSQQELEASKSSYHPSEETMHCLGRTRTDFFNKLLGFNEKADNFSELVKKVFKSREEYEKRYLLDQFKATKNFYNSIKGKIDTGGNRFWSTVIVWEWGAVNRGLKEANGVEKAAFDTYKMEENIVFPELIPAEK